MTTIRLAVVLLAILPAIAASQEPDASVAFARRITLQSKTLGEARAIDIALPRGYETSTARYPVIVVLDGEFEHEVVTASARFYSMMSMMPPTIVVGVRNTKRLRDLTPAPLTGFTVPPGDDEAGGADRFLAFLADELLPWIDHTYRTVPMRVLVGHSLGGLFATHALATKPAVFTGYLIMEPALWWNHEDDLRAASATLKRPEARRARVMLVNAQPLGDDTTHWGGSAPMVRMLSISGETHQSMAAQGVLLAFRTMFADFRPSDWTPGTKPIAMLERYDSLAARVGYAVPIPASAYEMTARMSIHAREFTDAERVIDRMRTTLGETPEVRALRDMLQEERSQPAPAGWIPLVIPARRPSPTDATAFIGTWVRTESGGPGAHEVTVRASGDTIVVRDRIQFDNGQWDEGDHTVIQVTPDGKLEWGLPWFRGLAALVVLVGELQPDGTMRVRREPRGWVPRGPSDDMHRVDIFQRVRR